MEEKIKAYLNNYLDSLDPNTRAEYTSFGSGYFCADEENANICSDLIRQGKKTATCGLKQWYGSEATKDPYPEIGRLEVVTDWYGNPTSIIKTVDLCEKKFNEVTADFAALEGEGDLSLEWWRKAHREYFSKACMKLGTRFSEEIMLVLERFVVVYR